MTGRGTGLCAGADEVASPPAGFGRGGFGRGRGGFGRGRGGGWGGFGRGRGGGWGGGFAGAGWRTGIETAPRTSPDNELRDAVSDAGAAEALANRTAALQMEIDVLKQRLEELEGRNREGEDR